LRHQLGCREQASAKRLNSSAHPLALFQLFRLRKLHERAIWQASITTCFRIQVPQTFKRRDSLSLPIAGACAFLLDEPTSGLDLKALNELSALINLLKENQMAILMATHDLFRARESGTRLGIMKHGQVVETLHAGSIGYADLEQLYLRHMHD
jgi:ABC-type Na+ transport system ATPase subunit NatA